jgi:NADPH2:quinone reductase
MDCTAVSFGLSPACVQARDLLLRYWTRIVSRAEGEAMRAAVVDRLMQPRELALRDWPEPEPGPGEVAVDVRAAGCNFADVLILKGEYQVKPTLPFVPGAEAAGVVAAIGEGVAGMHVGDRVLSHCGLGAFAERLVVPAGRLHAMPADMSFETAAALPIVYPTSFVALVFRARIESGETLLVHAAAGGVGLAAVQIGKALGARVIATAGGEDKLAVARRAGADVAIDYEREDFVAHVLEETDGRGADVIYDPVGGDTFDRSLKCIAWNGRLLVIGFASGRIPELRANRILLKNIGVLGVHWPAYEQNEPARVGETFAGLMRLWEEGGIEPLIHRALPLARVGEALEDLAGRRTVGKLVVLP